MSTQLAHGSTTLRSRLGQVCLLLLIIAALGVFGAYMLQPLAGPMGDAKPAADKPATAIQTSPAQDVLSVEWLEQQRAARGVVPSRAKAQDDVLSVEWLEQQRQGNAKEARDGNRAAQPIPDNYTGFIE